MPRELANLVDALIPGIIGVVILLFPRAFAGNNAPEGRRDKIKKFGWILICISLGYIMLKQISRAIRVTSQ